MEKKILFSIIFISLISLAFLANEEKEKKETKAEEVKVESKKEEKVGDVKEETKKEQKKEEKKEEKKSEEFEIPKWDKEKYFREALTEFLVKHKLLNSTRVIKQKEMRKIFMDIMAYTDPDGYYDFEFLFKDAMKYFVDLYYRKYKEIRGKDIINLIDVNEISKKINEISGLDKYNDLL